MTHGLGVRDVHKDRNMSKTRGKKYRKAQRHKNRRMEEKTQGHIDSVRCMITWRHRYKIRAMVPLGEYTVRCCF